MSSITIEKPLTRVGNSTGFVIGRNYLNDKLLFLGKKYKVTIEPVDDTTMGLMSNLVMSDNLSMGFSTIIAHSLKYECLETATS